MAKQKILFLENLPYKSHIKVGSHHYAELFAKEHDVLWISLPWHIFQLLKDRKSDRFKSWNGNKIQKVGDRFKTFTPFIPLPYRDFPILNNNWYLEHLVEFMPGIKKILKAEGFLNVDLVWFTDPRHISILKYIDADKIFYRCVDNLEHFSDVPKSLIEVEKKLIQQCYACFFTAKELYEKFDTLNNNSHYLPNGCEYDFFDKDTILGTLDKNVKKYFRSDKVNILYIGAIAEWFDFNVLDVASENSNFNFVIVGPVRVSIPSGINGKQNIHFIGPLPYKYMPALIDSADIGIIPFKINELTDSVNPIKLYEYCAGGLPVVSSSFKTIAEIEGPFYKYENATQFIHFLDKLSQNPYEAYTLNEIKEFAYNNSWEKRFLFIKQIINNNQ